MLKYALVIDNNIVEYRNYYEVPIVRYYNGLPLLRPVEFLSSPEFDPSIQKLEKVITILPDKVQISYNVVLLTQEEIDAATLKSIEAIQLLNDSNLIEAVKSDAQIKAFAKMNISEMNTYIDTNVSDITSIRAMFKFYGKILLWFIKREIRK